MQVVESPSIAKDWTTEEEIITHFRRAIEAKYVIAE